MQPVLHRREIRRDTVRILRAAAADKHLMLDAAQGLPTYDRPALVAWSTGAARADHPGLDSVFNHRRRGPSPIGRHGSLLAVI
jgi:hypothetical protein